MTDLGEWLQGNTHTPEGRGDGLSQEASVAPSLRCILLVSGCTNPGRRTQLPPYSGVGGACGQMEGWKKELGRAKGSRLKAVEHLPLAQVGIPGSWDGAPQEACFSLHLCLCLSLCVSHE